jgi:hypothetical protein
VDVGESDARGRRRRWRLAAVVGLVVLAGAFLAASRLPPVRRGYFLWQLERTYRTVPHEDAAFSPEFSRVMYYQQKLISEGEPVVQPLLALRHKYDYLWYWTTTTVVGALGSPQAEQPLIEDTADQDPAVVLQALTALGTLRELHCQKRLLTLLGSPFPRVREQTVYLVTNCGIRSAYPLLVGMLRSDPDPMVRAVTTHGVARLGGRDAIPLLIEALDDPGVTSTPPIVRVKGAALFWLCTMTGKDLPTKAAWELWWQEEQARQAHPSAPQP